MGTVVNLVHVGLGRVGGAALDILREQRKSWQEQFGISLLHRGFIDTSGGVACDEPGGYSDRTFDRLIAARSAGTRVFDAAPDIGLTPRTAGEAIDIALSMGKVIVIDCAASAYTAGISATAIEHNSGAVFSNKAPLALPLSDPVSQAIWAESHLGGLVRYETTCGAGLPIVSTLRSLLDSGDDVIEISGALSGTLGAIFADLSKGTAFSQAVRSAKELGYTEPDPRDDLSGLDLARKALILARTMGMSVDLDDITVESLVPASLAAVSVSEFLDQVSQSDGEIANRSVDAKSRGNSLKYLARVSRTDGISVGIQGVPSSTILGSLQGPENIVTFRTRRYDGYPLTVTGPGAGAQVTAAGVVADVLSLARDMREA